MMIYQFFKFIEAFELAICIHSEFNLTFEMLEQFYQTIKLTTCLMY